MFRKHSARWERGTSTLEAVMAMAILAALGVVVESTVTSTTPRGATRRAELTVMAANVVADVRAAAMYDGSVADALVARTTATRTVAIPGTTPPQTATCTSTFTGNGGPGSANVSVTCADAGGTAGQALGTITAAAPTPGAVVQ